MEPGHTLCHVCCACKKQCVLVLELMRGAPPKKKQCYTPHMIMHSNTVAFEHMQQSRDRDIEKR